jgi:poly(beta-D-mannuronate) lyase
MTDAAQKGDVAAGVMIDKWLGSWADGQALTKVDSQAGGFERKWTLSGLLIAYWRNSPYPQWQNTQKIDKWLDQLTHLMMEDYQEYKKGSQKNNHVYWAGLVAIEMATINSDKNLLDWGLEKVRFGISQVDSDGFLPLELGRKGKALQYHRVSLEALMMAAYFVKPQGIDLLSEKNSALDRLALTVLKGYENPALFADKVGTKQDFKLKDSTAWLAIYDFLRPGNLQVQKLLTEYPPVWTRTLGGNVPNVLNTKNGITSKKTTE